MQVPRLVAPIAHTLEAVGKGNGGMGNLSCSLLLAGGGGVLERLGQEAREHVVLAPRGHDLVHDPGMFPVARA